MHARKWLWLFTASCLYWLGLAVRGTHGFACLFWWCVSVALFCKVGSSIARSNL